MTGNDSGCVRIRAERIGARTAIVEAFRSVPFHLGLPSDRVGDGRAELILQNVGPGVLPGDRLRLALDVGPGATLDVRGQGATRIHPSPSGLPGEIETRLSVAERGLLILVPGELIPYRTARLRQTTAIEVARGGHLAMGETLTQGREAMGERDVYNSLDLRIRASHGGRLVLIERARLEPAKRAPGSVGRHGPFAVSASLYLMGERWRMPSEPHGAREVTWAIDAGDGYLLGRVLGPTTQAVSAVVHRLLTEASVGLTEKCGTFEP
jgi:urease accessory protein